jgi:hypothetical protein
VVHIPYHGERIVSASVGTRLATVVCEVCGREYFYELARVGSGAETAPYYIGRERAERSAQDQAQQDLDRRLAEEAEIVPCPKCGWINDGLVAGYRLGRYRGWGKAAAGIAIVGSALSLVAVWFLAIGPPADRGALPYVLVGGPALALAIAGLILFVRRWLRARIQPNRNYPELPSVPAGSPVALVRNPASGELHVAAPLPRPDGRAGASTDIQVGRSVLPPFCCVCLGPVTPGAAYRHPVRPAVEVAVPLCAACARRWRWRKRLGALAGLGAGAVIGIPILLALKLDEVVFWFVLLLAGPLVPIVGAMIAGHLAAPVHVKVIDGPRGVARLRFRNEGFVRWAFKDEATSR